MVLRCDETRKEKMDVFNFSSEIMRLSYEMRFYMTCLQLFSDLFAFFLSEDIIGLNSN